ncbi:dehydrogenase [Paenibacillus agricola]|uniref:Dehydrogenase n=1 Tax=Paenibacillus agricola TaxID=2716264 RepID=A0ABX0JCS1_9BACL|nr:dehydrogenase [Paenibacillus agricola]NHN33046.1 dehydrogenase [Paenibacillus agricola]
MPNPGSHNVKHDQEYPTARKIRRSCSRELFRTRKKLGQWIAPELVKQADELYYKKVLLNLPWIVANGSNRRLLSDWWDEHIGPEIAELWDVDPAVLSKAFRDAFGG